MQRALTMSKRTMISVIFLGLVVLLVRYFNSIAPVESGDESLVVQPVQDVPMQGSNTAELEEGVAAIAGAVKEVPDFSAMTRVKQKKYAFFEYMYPFIELSNIRVLEQRKFLREMLARSSNSYSEPELARVQQLAIDYGLAPDVNEPVKLVKKLLPRVDLIPPSLVLAQSANESAWGTSRFARQGNNYFGQWCFSAGCGLVPTKRTRGAKHEVRRFDSPAESVTSYISNLNSGKAYKPLRTIRAASRAKHQRPGGSSLAEGLGRYSERGGHYVAEIISMIRFNKLVAYDHRFWVAVEGNSLGEQ